MASSPSFLRITSRNSRFLRCGLLRPALNSINSRRDKRLPHSLTSLLSLAGWLRRRSSEPMLASIYLSVYVLAIYKKSI